MLLRVVLFSFLLLLLPSTVHAQKRVALVIGNSTYQHAGELANPKNDATDMAASLRSAGFQVIEGYDLNKAALDRKIRDFATALRGAQAGLFFYAGHGLQVSGQNYIVPVDAELTTEFSARFRDGQARPCTPNNGARSADQHSYFGCLPEQSASTQPRSGNGHAVRSNWTWPRGG